MIDQIPNPIFQSTILHRQSTVLVCILIQAFLLVHFVQDAVAQDAVRIWTESMTIPTYELGQDDPNPYFGEGYREIYPYPLQDHLTGHRVNKSWTAVLLENKFLKVIVLPELGGHVYSVYDKSFRREVFYRNNVVKYGLVGLRGAWVSGGIEFNFPNGHTVTSVSAVDFALRNNPDGSASILLGDHEKVSRMHWFVALTLYPDKAYLEQEVFLYNRTPVKNRYWFWANAAVPASEDVQYIYPMASAYPHAKFPVYTFPVYQGRDLSWWKNVEEPLSLFARASKRDFFGAYYYHEKNFGVVHVANFQEVPGKKTWTWGTAPSGRIWDTLLSDKDGPYAEIQSGRFETQLDYEFLNPHQADHWMEYWYPVNQMGSFVSANKEVAVNLELFPDETKPRQIRLGASPTASLKNILLTLKSGNGEIFRKVIDVSPERPYSETIEAPAAGVNPKDMILQLSDSLGREIIRFSTAEPRDGNPRPPAIPTQVPAGITTTTNVEEVFLEGVRLEKQGEEVKAREMYQKALELDPGHSRSHVSLGILLYKTGEFDQAHQEIEAGLKRNPYDDVANYYHGLYHRNHGELDLARDNFWKLIRNGVYAPLGYYQLGEVALQEREYEEAIDHLSKATAMNPLDIRAQDLLAIATRKAGKPQEALAQIEGVLRFDPLDYLALYEVYLIHRELKNSAATDKARDRLLEVLSRDDEIYLEVQQDYQNVGLAEESIGILQMALNQPRKRAINPFIHYTLGILLDLQGKTTEARQHFDQACQTKSDWVFPYRLESIAVLQTALKYNPQDDKAHYYLGNLLYAKKRYLDGMNAWETSVGLNPDFSVAQRNLGFAYWKQQHNLEKAIQHYEQAVNANNADYRLYRDLDQLYTLTGQEAKRLALLEKAPMEVSQVQDIALANAALQLDRGNYRKALEILMACRFKPWEGGRAIREVYVNATIGQGDQALAERKYEAAIQSYAEALKYPENLGVGGPGKREEARTLYLWSEVYVAKGQVPKAKELWEQIAKQEGNPLSENTYYRGLALRKLGKEKEANALFDQLVSGAGVSPEEEQSSALRLFLSGLGQKGKGNLDQAKQAFMEAFKQDPSLWRAKRELNKR